MVMTLPIYIYVKMANMTAIKETNNKKFIHFFLFLKFLINNILRNNATASIRLYTSII